MFSSSEFAAAAAPASTGLAADQRDLRTRPKQPRAASGLAWGNCNRRCWRLWAGVGARARPYIVVSPELQIKPAATTYSCPARPTPKSRINAGAGRGGED